jgi:hypothetical protein
MGEAMQKTIRSRFDHQVGDLVEGCTVLEKRVVIPPDPVERRRGVYDYVVDAPPAPAAPARKSSRRETTSKPAASSPPERGSYTRATPEEMNGAVIRRLPSR